MQFDFQCVLEKLLLLDTNQRIKIAKNAREHIENNFSRDKMTNETIKIYEKLILKKI